MILIIISNSTSYIGWSSTLRSQLPARAPNPLGNGRLPDPKGLPGALPVIRRPDVVMACVWNVRRH